MGAEVGRGSGGWEVSVDNIQLTEPGTVLFGKSILVMSQIMSSEIAKHC